MRTLRVLVAAALCWAAAVVGAPTASAHAVRIATDPAVDAMLASGPPQVSATFNEALQTGFAAMTVVGPDGNLWSTGDTHVQGAIASVAVRPLGAAGSYTVNYRVTSADGHVVSGSWPFHLTTPGTGKPGPPAAEPTGGGTDGIAWWPFAAAGAGMVTAAMLWSTRRRS